MIIFGLTGGISTGKTFVTNQLLEAQIPVIDCDAIAKSILQKGTSGLDAVVKEFGPDILLENGTLNRVELGRIIFADPEKRKKLTAITGPRIFRAVLWELGKHFFFASPIVVIDAPTLFETKFLVPLCSKIIVITTTPELQLLRLMQRDSSNEKDAMNRIRAQLPLAEKEARADIVIRNDLGFDELKLESAALVVKLHNLSSNPIRRVLVSFPGIVLIVGAIFIMVRK